MCAQLAQLVDGVFHFLHQKVLGDLDFQATARQIKIVEDADQGIVFGDRRAGDPVLLEGLNRFFHQQIWGKAEHILRHHFMDAEFIGEFFNFGDVLCVFV